MTTNLSDRLGRWTRLALLCLAATLAACGPGTGGTGTGPLQGTANFSGIAAPSALPSGAACQGPCEIALKLEPQRVELNAGCRRFIHVGDWSLDAEGKSVIEGQLETTTAAGTASVPATLQLQFSERDANSARVTAVVTGEGGSVLAGPAVLQRGDTVITAAAPDCRA